MANAARTARKTKRPPALAVEILKSAVMAALLSLVLVVLYAVALRQEWLSTDTMGISTTAIKVICAAVAGLRTAHHAKGKLWLYGILSGAAYSLLSFAVFSLLSQTFVLSLAILSDLGMATAAGLFAVLILQIYK
ncbi:MAG: TIGR04086 family membrane protein [Christensenellaceae bacterium]|jgi:putative membrane protein (TIGR04086 family)|nr:TIGR04086 family membrane protein [Christensenellaceae bacterium]